MEYMDQIIIVLPGEILYVSFIYNPVIHTLLDPNVMKKDR